MVRPLARPRDRRAHHHQRHAARSPSTGEARVVRRPLIGPAGPHTATAISATQVEGYAVVRVAYPTDAKGKPKVGAPLRNVEVAWENFLEGTSARARIPDAGPLEREDIVPVPGGLDFARRRG